MHTRTNLALAFFSSLFLASCGGGGGGSGGGGTNQSEELILSMGAAETSKTLHFSWPTITSADHYSLLENPDGNSGFSVISSASSLPKPGFDLEIPIHLTSWSNALYRVEALDETGSVVDASASVPLSGSVQPEEIIGELEASNRDPSDIFGADVALSADGRTMAVGAIGEDSGASGINGSEIDNSAGSSGAVYVFVKNSDGWSQEAYIKASNTDSMDHFGHSVAIDDDGSTIVVGAPQEDSNATGVNGNESDNSEDDSGAVYVFTKELGGWSQHSYIKAPNSNAGDRFGASSSLSSDGSVLAIGAPDEDSSSSTIGGNQEDNGTTDAGAVYVFSLANDAWFFTKYVKAPNPDIDDWFGASVSLANSGTFLAVGAPRESSNARGVDGDKFNNMGYSSGAVYTFIKDSSEGWLQQSYIKPSNTEENVDVTDGGPYYHFGENISLSSSGDVLAVGATGEASGSTGINGDEFNNDKFQSGAVYVFSYKPEGWSQDAYIKSANTGIGDDFGNSLALNSQGNVLAIGAYEEDSSATGINGDMQNNNATDSGAGYIYVRAEGEWSFLNYVKPPSTMASRKFGRDMEISGDGGVLVVGATFQNAGSLFLY